MYQQFSHTFVCLISDILINTLITVSLCEYIS